jgi:hypothetical protein
MKPPAPTAAGDPESDSFLTTDPSDLRQHITAASLTAPGSVGVPIEEVVEVPPLTLKDTVLCSMGIWLTVLILLIMCVPQMEVKGLVTR